MSDLIDRQAAIDALGEMVMNWTDSDYELGQLNQWKADRKAIIDLPSAQPEKTQLSGESTTKDSTFDCISRQAVLDAVRNIRAIKGTADDEILLIDKAEVQTELMRLPSAQPQWIPVTERLPEDIRPVIVTWCNTDPTSYYQYIVGKRFIGVAHYKSGKWYWYSSTTEDFLAEYGQYDGEEFDEAIEVLAWCEMPEPYKGEQE